MVIGLLAVAIVCFVLTHRTLVGALYDRQKVMDVHMKSVTREALVACREAEQATKAAHQIRDDAQQLLARVEVHLSNPDLRRLLGG